MHRGLNTMLRIELGLAKCKANYIYLYIIFLNQHRYFHCWEQENTVSPSMWLARPSPSLATWLLLLFQRLMEKGSDLSSADGSTGSERANSLFASWAEEDKKQFLRRERNGEQWGVEWLRCQQLVSELPLLLPLNPDEKMVQLNPLSQWGVLATESLPWGTDSCCKKVDGGGGEG